MLPRMQMFKRGNFDGMIAVPIRFRKPDIFGDLKMVDPSTVICRLFKRYVFCGPFSIASGRAYRLIDVN